MMLSVIIPAHNEEASIIEVIKRIEGSVSIAHELVVVDDHSTDKTKELLGKFIRQSNNIKLVENKLEQGFANAIKTGFANASGDVLLPVMADLCDDILTLNKLYDKINEGYDVVCGCRYIKGGARLGGSRLKGFLSFFAGWSIHYLLGVPTLDIANAFKMYRKKVIDSIEIESKGFEISMEIPLKAYYSGFRITEVPTVWRERTRGKSNFRMLKLLPNYFKLYIWAVFKKLTG